MNKTKIILYSFKRSLPVMSGYIVLGMGFGILLQSKGYGVLWSLAMSIFIYAGSLQYVGIELITSTASFFTTAIMSLMVNIRHLFYGISMLEKYKKNPIGKIYNIFALTDETYSLVCSNDLPEDIDENHYFFYLSLFDHLWWITGSVLGSLVGNFLPFSTAGIDFSMTALFIVILVGQWENNKNHLACYTGFVVSIGCLIIFGPTNFLIPTMIVITFILIVFRKQFDKEV